MLDTNILISIAVFNSEYLKELLEKICDNYTLVLSSFIIDELNTVIERKFPSKKEDFENFLYKIPYDLEYIPDTIINNAKIEIRDKNDIPILYSAILADVNILITGDKDFDSVNLKRSKIVTARKFLEKYGKIRWIID